MNNHPFLTKLQQYRIELSREILEILNYWIEYTPDQEHGGFIGKVDKNNKRYPEAPKGAVLNARILWSFSAGFLSAKDPRYLKMADRAFDYISQHFIDKEFGGVYWSLNYEGKPLETNKEVYACAFMVYALSEYYKISKKEDARRLAVEIFEAIEKHSYDPQFTGYIDAFDRQWNSLTSKGGNLSADHVAKTMNTHLHLLEAYTQLYNVWPDEKLKIRLESLLNNFLGHILDKENSRLKLFFDKDWRSTSPIISYGHDIEASWLLPEAAEAIHNEALITTTRSLAVKMATAALAGLDKDGGLWYELNPKENKLMKEKHWWPQAEAMVGFFNAWEIAQRDDRFLTLSLNSWEFVKKYLKDKKGGEWYWGVKENYEVMSQDKAGMWKCPYHNGRACLEIIQRINAISRVI